MGRRFWLFLLLVLGLGMGNAHGQQFWVGSVYNPTLGEFVHNVQVFDWASSGSGVAEGMGPAGSELAVGDEFLFRYQSFLVRFEDDQAFPVAFPGLNEDFEFTVVAQIPEVVQVYVPGANPTVIFSTLPGVSFTFTTTEIPIPMWLPGSVSMTVN